MLKIRISLDLSLTGDAKITIFLRHNIYKVF